MKKIIVILLFSLMLFGTLYSQIMENSGIAKINEAMCNDATPEDMLHPSEKLITNTESRNSSILYVNAQNNADPIFKASVASLPNVGTFTEFDAYSATPDVAYLLGFDVVIVASNYVFADPTTLGNNLASYVDQGGSVCLIEGSFSSGFSLQGLIMDPTYSPFTVANYSLATESCSNFVTHPITSGVSYIETGLYTFSSLQGNGVSLGVYGTGDHVAAYNPDLPIVAINVFPTDGFWGGDFIQMISNTIDWFTTPEISVTPSSMDEYLNFGETATQILNIANNGTGDLTFNLSHDYITDTESSTPRNYGDYADRSRINISEISLSGMHSTLKEKEFSENRAAGDVLGTYTGMTASNLGMVWVEDLLYVVHYEMNQLAVYDISTQSVITTYAIHSTPFGITWDGNYLWVGDGGGNVYAYNLDGSSAGYSFSCPVATFPTLTWDGEYFLTSPYASIDPTINKLDATGTIIDSYTGSSVTEICQIVWVPEHTGGNLWMTDRVSIIAQLDLTDTDGTYTIVSSFPRPAAETNYAWSITHHNFNLWWSDYDGPLYEIDDGIEELTWFSYDISSGTLAPGENIDVTVTFDATEVYGGTYMADLEVSSNDPVNPLVIVPVTLEVTGEPDIETDVTSIDFGTLEYGQSTTDNFTVSNVGTDWLEVSDIVCDNSDFAAEVVSLLDDITIEVTVDYYWNEATWNLWSDATSSYYFGSNQGFTASYETITTTIPLDNGTYSIHCWDGYGDGGIAGIVTDSEANVLVSWNAYDYSTYAEFNFVVSGASGLDFSLYPMEEQAVIVTFTPTSSGTITGDLTIYSNDPDEPEVVIALSGVCISAQIVVDPTSMSEALLVGETSDQILTILNVGDLELTYSTGINFLRDRDNIPRPNYLPYNDNYPRRKDVEPSAEIDMSNVRYEKSFKEPSIDILRGSIAWFKAGEYSTYFYGTFDTDTPGDMTEILSPPAWNAYCGDFDTINTDFFYVNNPDDYNTYVVDCATGAAALIGPTGLTAFLNGMACDKTEGTMYAVDSSNLYTIDLSTGAAILVGPIGNTGGLMLTLACDGDGELWGIDLTFDTLWNIDKVTGAGIEIGPVGFNCGYAQSMSWDPDTDIIFWAAYGGGLDGNLRIVDTTTGATTLVGDFEGGREVTVLAFPGVEGVGDWLSITNNGSGVVPSGGSVDVAIHFDATNLFGGTYEAELVVSNNDPNNLEVIVPVTLDVTGIPDIAVDPVIIDYGAHYVGATIEEILTIFSTGTDDLEITDITSNNPDFYCDVTTYTISPGNSEGVIVNFNPSTVGIITGILTVYSNDPNEPEVYIDLEGEGLDAPEIVITPASFDINIAPDVIVDEILTIENTGVVDVNYDISIEYMIQTDRVRNYGDYADRSRESSTEIDPFYRMNSSRQINNNKNRTAGDILGTYTGMPIDSNTGMVWVGDLLYIVQYFSDLLNVYDISDQSIIATYPIHGGPFGITWDGNYLWIGDGAGNVYAYNLDGTSASFSIISPIGGMLTLTWDGEYFVSSLMGSYDPTIYKYDETGAIIDSYTGSIGMEIYNFVWVPQHTGGNLWANCFIYDTIAQLDLTDTDGSYTMVSSFTDPSPDWESYAISYHNFNLWWADWDGPLYEIDDGIVEFGWLSVDITSGTLSTGQSDDITLTVDANEVDSLGVYEASLVIVSNDPDDPVVYVPVTLTVNYPPEIVLPDDFTFEEDNSLIVDFDTYITDPNSSPYELSVAGNTNVTVDIVGSEVTFGAAPDWYGTETLTFTVDDGQTDSDVVDVIVTPVNDDPTIVLPDDFTFDEDEELIVDFSVFIDDVDPDDLTLSVTGNIEVTVDIDVFEVTFGATENWNGSEILTFTVDDNQGDGVSFIVGKKSTIKMESSNIDNNRATAEDDVEVIVTPVNDEPVLIGFLPEDLEFTVVEDSTVTFSVDVEDIDSTIDYEWFVNDVLQTESTEEFVHIFEVVGDIEIKSVASDEEYEIETIWIVHVEPGSGAGNELLPVVTVLSKNFPNPFNPTTTIKFDIKEKEKGKLSIYNMKGQLVFTKSFGAGHHNFLWDAASCSSGIYFYKLVTPSYFHTRKMILLK